MFWDKDKNYTKRTAKEYNVWRTIFQFIICRIFYMIRLKLVYRLEVYGLENVPKDNEYIVCPNHLSTLDPPMVAGILPRRVSFMAKKELFDIPFIRWWIDWLGTFAVNRESLGPSRGVPGTITGVTKGFAGLAKITKCAVLPVGIVGTQEAKHIPFTGKVIVKIGKPIPYDDNPDVVVQKWIDAIQELTGFKYIPHDDNVNLGVKNSDERKKL